MEEYEGLAPHFGNVLNGYQPSFQTLPMRYLTSTSEHMMSRFCHMMGSCIPPLARRGMRKINV